MDERIKRETTANRATRAVEDQPRKGADEQLESSKERRRMFREFVQEALPKPPEVPGWHFIWLSTTNQYDPLYKRMRMGYEAVKAEEIPGYANYRVKSGEFEGLIQVNEMLLFKIPEEIYQEMMAELHYHMPNEEEDMLRANLVNKDLEDSNGRQLGSFDKDDQGFSSLGRVKVPVPTFE